MTTQGLLAWTCCESTMTIIQDKCFLLRAAEVPCLISKESNVRLKAILIHGGMRSLDWCPDWRLQSETLRVGSLCSQHTTPSIHHRSFSSPVSWGALVLSFHWHLCMQGTRGQEWTPFISLWFLILSFQETWEYVISYNPHHSPAGRIYFYLINNKSNAQIPLVGRHRGG